MDEIIVIKERKSWYGKVYHKTQNDIDPDYWEYLRNIVLDRDNYKCQSCFSKTVHINFLTAHHIIPRKEGGTNDLDNLITLCTDCHNIIELTDIRARCEIIGYGAPEEPIKGSKIKDRNDYALPEDIKAMLERVDAKCPDWHRKVYGGEK